MSTYNICFHGEIRKIAVCFGGKRKMPILELCIIIGTGRHEQTV